MAYKYIYCLNCEQVKCPLTACRAPDCLHECTEAIGALFPKMHWRILEVGLCADCCRMFADEIGIPTSPAKHLEPYTV